MTLRLRSCVLLAALLGSCAQMPPDIAEKVKAIGPVIDPAKTASIYGPLQEKEPYQGVKVKRELKYGPDERQALDVFAPESAGAGRPVLVFVHGGGFVAGSKHAPDSPFYDNVVLAAAREGIVGVNVEYRLAPQHKWPAGAADVGDAVRWVHENIAAYGGDPKRVYLMGHSAGAIHVASYVAFPEYQKADGLGLAGAILASGLYDYENTQPNKAELAYFGDKAGTKEVSSLGGLVAAPIPLMVVNAEIDPPAFFAQGNLLNDALCARGKCPRRVVLKGHSHMSEVYAIDTSDRSLADPLFDFVKAGR